MAAKSIAKTDNHGHYFSLGARPGNYKITLFGADGNLIFSLDNVPAKLGVENVYDFDLAKLKARSRQGIRLTEEQRKASEKVKKENEKIKGLNALLPQAAAAEEGKQVRRRRGHHGAGRRPGSDPRRRLRLARRRLPRRQKVPRGRDPPTTRPSRSPRPPPSPLATITAVSPWPCCSRVRPRLGMAECDKTAQLDPTTGRAVLLQRGRHPHQPGQARRGQPGIRQSHRRRSHPRRGLLPEGRQPSRQGNPRQGWQDDPRSRHG